eukprot:Nk52_evm2s1892 gene=Nk52_evmTU2s1892
MLGWSHISETLPVSTRIVNFPRDVSEQYRQYVFDANRFFPLVTINMRRGSSAPVSFPINAFEQPEMDRGIVQVCFQYTSPFVGRLTSGCKANLTAGDKIPINVNSEFVPMMLINPKATKEEDVLKVVNPPQNKEDVYPETKYAPTTESCPIAVDIDN